MLDIRNLCRKFPNFELHDLNLNIEKGEYFILLGDSGSGKSLTLEMIAGLVEPDKGAIFLDNEDITHKRIQKRNTGLVFQTPALFPHMTVRSNILFGVNCRDKRDRLEALDKATWETGTSSLLDRMPGTLSGGEMQRVALARMLARKPRLLLLDEPLSSLDISSRHSMQKLLKNINRSTGLTILHVTHDLHEARNLANRIAIIRNRDGRSTITDMEDPSSILTHYRTQLLLEREGINE